MYERVDTSSTVEIEQNTSAKVALVVGLLALVAVGLWQLTDPDGMLRSNKAVFAIWSLILISATLAVLGAVQLITLRGAVLAVSPAGVLDRRVSHDMVPWTGITAVGEWHNPHKRYARGSKAVLLSLAPHAADSLRLTGMAQLTGRSAASVRADGLVITIGGLKASYYDIRNLITAFATAHANLDHSSSRLARQS